MTVKLSSYERSQIYADLLTELFCHLPSDDLRFIVSWVGVMQYISEDHLLNKWDALPDRYRSEKGRLAAQVLRETP